MSRRVLINLVFFNVVFGVMLFWAVNNIVTLDRIERPYTITGDFAQAAGVQANAEVTYLGVHYGRVSSVERRAGGVRITMKIDRGKDIPAGLDRPRSSASPPSASPTSTSCRRRTLRGGRRPASSRATTSRSERTTVPLEFSELLRSASALISSIDPDAGRQPRPRARPRPRRARARTSATSRRRSTRSPRTFAERTDAARPAGREQHPDHPGAGRPPAQHRPVDHQPPGRRRGAAQRQGRPRRCCSRSARRSSRTTADLVADQKQNLDCLLTDLAPVLRLASDPSTSTTWRRCSATGPPASATCSAPSTASPTGPGSASTSRSRSAGPTRRSTRRVPRSRSCPPSRRAPPRCSPASGRPARLRGRPASRRRGTSAAPSVRPRPVAPPHRGRGPRPPGDAARRPASPSAALALVLVAARWRWSSSGRIAR